MRAPGLGAFELSTEPVAALDAYGDSDFGRRCLTARRLVESGVRLFATVAKQLGLDPNKSFDTPSGRPIAISDGGRPLGEITG